MNHELTPAQELGIERYCNMVDTEVREITITDAEKGNIRVTFLDGFICNLGPNGTTAEDTEEYAPASFSAENNDPATEAATAAAEVDRILDFRLGLLDRAIKTAEITKLPLSEALAVVLEFVGSGIVPGEPEVKD